MSPLGVQGLTGGTSRYNIGKRSELPRSVTSGGTQSGGSREELSRHRRHH